MITKATAPVDTITPRKFHKPDHSTATFGASEWVGSVVEAVHELEAERDEKGDAEQDKGKPGLGYDAGVPHLEIDIQPGIEDAGEQDGHEKNGGRRRDRMIELGLGRCACR
jgi:hypothetical protein